MTKRILPVFERHEPTSLDHTATKEFKKCPRSYFYRMVLGRSAPEGQWETVFAWGSSLHKFLEVLYKTDNVLLATEEAAKLFRAPSHHRFMFQDKARWNDTILELFKFYTEEKRAGMIEVLAIEQPWHLVFPDGKTIGGRFDQLVKWNGRIWVRDWKTTSKQLNYFSMGLDPNDQAMRYIYAASCLQFGQDKNGYPVKVIDGVLFPAIINMKSVGPKIQVVTRSSTLSQVCQWVEEQKFIHRQMDMCREEDIWPMYEVNCGFCDYRVVCTQPSEAAMENMLRMSFKLQPWDHTTVDQTVKAEA
jgi:CRISPR/Cas system-associated exonuclease Cas4 (RecB family)